MRKLVLMLYLLIGSVCFAFEADSIVYYHYAYVEPVPQPAEDEIIALRYHQKAVGLVFWGTTDEFDDAREGYLPGFFVLSGENLVQTGDTLSFTLSIKGEKVFERPVPVTCFSGELVKGIPLSANSYHFTNFLDDKRFQLLRKGSVLYLIDQARDSRKRFERKPLGEIMKLKRVLKGN